MARYFWGNTLASFFRSAAGVVEVTTAGRFDSAFVANAISIGVGEFIETMPFVDASSANTLSAHFEVYSTSASTGAGSTLADFKNAAGTILARVTSNSGTTLRFEYWNGSAFVNAGTFTFTTNLLLRFDVVLTCGSPGTFVIYRGGTSVLSGTMNAAVTALAKVRFGLPSTNGTAFFSQVMGADFDTRDSRYYQQVPAALGTLTDGSGAVSDINETVLDESTSVSLPTSGNKRSFTHPTLTLPAGYMIGAVCAAARGRINGSGPSDGKLGIYDITAATSYLSSGLSLNSGYEPRGAYWAPNPNTATDWTAADWNDAEIILAAA